MLEPHEVEIYQEIRGDAEKVFSFLGVTRELAEEFDNAMNRELFDSLLKRRDYLAGKIKSEFLGDKPLLEEFELLRADYKAVDKLITQFEGILVTRGRVIEKIKNAVKKHLGA